MRALIAGAGGFIGGHLTRDLLKKGYEVICADIKPVNEWYQSFEGTQKFQMNLKNLDNCKKITKSVDHVYNLACNMGGMGFIENNKADCMLSVLINTNLLISSKESNVKKYFFSSSACVYARDKQKDFENPYIKESDAYPAACEDGYGWEKLFSERMCRHFFEDYGLETRIGRFHNCYGPYGTWKGGREKAPAALSRKFIEAKEKNLNEIEIWGDGKQLRSFMYIDDCITGINLLFESNYREPINIGASDFVSINELVDLLEKISEMKVKRKYMLDAPKGVDARSSDNTQIKNILKWEPNFELHEGLKNTFEWIYKEYKKTN